MGAAAGRGGIHAAALIRPHRSPSPVIASAAKQSKNLAAEAVWIASSQELLAKTMERASATTCSCRRPPPQARGFIRIKSQFNGVIRRKIIVSLVFVSLFV